VNSLVLAPVSPVGTSLKVAKSNKAFCPANFPNANATSLN